MLDKLNKWVYTFSQEGFKQSVPGAEFKTQYWRKPMPFITTSPAPIRPVRELLEVQDLEAYVAAETKRERNFKIKFGICLVASVFIGTFLWTIMVF